MMSYPVVFNVSNMAEGGDNCIPMDPNQNIPSYMAYILKGVLFIIVILNTPPIIALFFTKVKASNFVSLHILSLSLTDCGVGLSFILLGSSSEIFIYWDCWSRMVVFNVMYISSMTQVAVICLDRTLLFYNLAWKSITKDSILLLKLVLGTFLITVVITLIPFCVFPTPHDISMCNMEIIFEGKTTTFMLYNGIISTCLEMFTILCTVATIRFLWKQSSRRVNPHTSAPSHNLTKEARAMGSLGIIVALYMILTTPIHIYYLVNGITGKCTDSKLVLVLTFVACLNSAFNPVVYSCRIPEMREALKTIWNKMCRC